MHAPARSPMSMVVLILSTVVLAAAGLLAGCSGSEVTPIPSAPRQSAGPLPGQSSIASPSTTLGASSVASPVVFAIIGDYGTDDSYERSVARLVNSWHPHFIVAAGDDYYKVAGGNGTARYDESTGAHYGKWLKDITTTGKRLPVGKAPVNSFFPVLGNHDYSDALPSPRTYLTYFDLPGSGFANSSGNERYYDFVDGPMHFFMLNSNGQEPDGTSATSKQARWLKAALARSTSRWNIVVDHHPPYSSDNVHHSIKYMRWPFASWGADAVVSGHAHVYERLSENKIPYFINGLGGASRYNFGKAIAGSKVRFRSTWGAQKVTASATSIRFDFYDVSGKRRDTFTLKTATP